MRIQITIAIASAILFCSAAPAGASPLGEVSAGDRGGTPSVAVQLIDRSAGSKGGGAGSGAAVVRDSGGSSDKSAAAAPPMPTVDCNAAIPYNASSLEWYQAVCGPGATPAPGKPAAPVIIDPREVAMTAVLQLPLPLPTPEVGPPPSANQWNSAFVGYPLWLSAGGSANASATITLAGLPITLVAARNSVRFDMGDGTSVSCTSTTKWTRGVEPGAASPDCGHTYQEPGRYTITATSSWSVQWTALGQSGIIPITKTATMALPVGELQSVNTTGG